MGGDVALVHRYLHIRILGPGKNKEEKEKRGAGLVSRTRYSISIREEGNSLPEGTATAAQQSRLFTRRPAAEGKLLLRVYLPRPVVGHRVAKATALPSGGGAEAPFGVVAVADQVL